MLIIHLSERYYLFLISRRVNDHPSVPPGNPIGLSLFRKQYDMEKSFNLNGNGVNSNSTVSKLRTSVIVGRAAVNGSTIFCTTQKEFEKALENRVRKIVYEGPDAEKILAGIKNAEAKKASARRWGLGIGVLALLAAPFTGGTSLLGLGATFGAVALSDTVIVAIITAIVSISVAAINAIKEYNIEKDRNRLVLTRK